MKPHPYLAPALVLLACMAVAGCKRSLVGTLEDSPGHPQISPGLSRRLKATTAADHLREGCQRLFDAAKKDGSSVAFTDPLVRAEVLGRAKAAPVFFVRSPKSHGPKNPSPQSRRPAAAHKNPAAYDMQRKIAAHRTVTKWLRQPAGTTPNASSPLLREGYLFARDPHLAQALVRKTRLAKLFSAGTIWRQRGAEVSELSRVPTKGGHEYRADVGTENERSATIHLFDRVVTAPQHLNEPLHRDARSVRNRYDLRRVEILGATSRDVAAKLVTDTVNYNAVLRPTSDGIQLEVLCLDASVEQRATLERRATAAPGRELRALRSAVKKSVLERLPFDRPRGVTDHLSDGQLRHLFNFAHRQGRRSFEHEGNYYRVFDPHGRPMPPQMCVEFILDSYERASGSWYGRQGQANRRPAPSLNFSELGLKNRAGVLAFETFAIEHPDLFTSRAWPFAESIPFANRTAYFANLLKLAPTIEAGDIIAIQGPKPDGYVHQHAILVIDTDPLTGFPYALADQMKKPRIRTWEDVMAEAPRRRLRYHVRLSPSLMAKLVLPRDAQL